MAVVYDKLLGKPLLHTHPGTGLTFSEYDNSDPTSSPGDVWVRRNFTTDGSAGEPRGLLLALTYSGNGVSTYKLSYKNAAGNIIRTTLS